MLTQSKLQWQKDLRGADLTPTEYMVLMTLSTYSSKDGTSIRPGWTRLVEDTHLDPRTVKRAVASLIQKGFLAQTKAGGNQFGYKQANVYELVQMSSRGTSDAPLDDDDDEGSIAPESPPEADDEGVHLVHEGVHLVQGRGTSGVDEGVHPVTPHQGSYQGLVSSPKKSSSATESRPRTAADSGSKQASPEPIPAPQNGHTWDDLLADYDIFEEWIDFHLGLDPVEYSTAHGMWENERHPKAIYNTIISRRRGATA